MFYILTDADAHRDHFLAYFSQEKVSYDDYNLACIVTLPPYQKRGYGMLLIEFSESISSVGGVFGWALGQCTISAPLGKFAPCVLVTPTPHFFCFSHCPSLSQLPVTRQIAGTLQRLFPNPLANPTH